MIMCFEVWTSKTRSSAAAFDRSALCECVQRGLIVCCKLHYNHAPWEFASVHPSCPTYHCISILVWWSDVQYIGNVLFNSHEWVTSIHVFLLLLQNLDTQGIFFYLSVCLSSFITNEKVKFALIHFVFLITLEKCWHVGFPLSSQMNMDPTVQKWGMSKARAQKRYYIDIKVFRWMS